MEKWNGHLRVSILFLNLEQASALARSLNKISPSQSLILALTSEVSEAFAQIFNHSPVLEQ